MPSSITKKGPKEHQVAAQDVIRAGDRLDGISLGAQTAPQAIHHCAAGLAPI